MNYKPLWIVGILYVMVVLAAILYSHISNLYKIIDVNEKAVIELRVENRYLNKRIELLEKN